jgi:hypothetical protein
MIEDQQQPFSVQVKVDDNIEDLKRETQRERKKDLLHYDTSEIVLLKVRLIISVDVPADLLSQLNDPIPSNLLPNGLGMPILPFLS